MQLKRKKVFGSIGRSIRATTAIVVVGVASTASADNFLTRWFPALNSAQSTVQAAQSKPSVVKGELIYVVCSDQNVAVRGSNINQIEFQSRPHEVIKPFQGWGENKREINVNGQKVNFVRAQFDSEGRSTNVGWIQESLVKLKSQCSSVAKPVATQDVVENIASLNDPKCCHFPISHQPFMSYTTGERQFGALRDKGRIHGGSDLYGNHNESILSVAPGKVIRGLYNFYFGTYAVDVKHPGFVVRYGEVSGKRASKAVTGETLSTGETVAHMGQLIPRIRPPMLHFEMYNGTMSGPLSVPTNRKNKYGRRKDIINPTSYLQHWENKTF